MPLQRTRSILVLALFPLLALVAGAQFKTTLVNSQGATAPCVGIGPVGGPLAKKCVELFGRPLHPRRRARIHRAHAWDIRQERRHHHSHCCRFPAEQSDLKTGDLLMKIGDKLVQPTPGQLAAQALFGERGAPVPSQAQPQWPAYRARPHARRRKPARRPKSPNFFIVLKAMINWRGQFVPCVGAGPAMGAIEYCYGHFKPFGYIKLGEFATTGISVDTARADKAIVTAVEPNSAAAKAAIQPGDEILEVDSKPLTAHLGVAANELLYGKAGDTLHVTVKRGGEDVNVNLLLAAKTN